MEREAARKKAQAAAGYAGADTSTHSQVDDVLAKSQALFERLHASPIKSEGVEMTEGAGAPYARFGIELGADGEEIEKIETEGVEMSVGAGGPHARSELDA